MTSAELTALFLEFYRDKVALRARHVAGAMRVTNYDFNNAYQYIVAREDQHVGWVLAALEALEAGIPENVPVLPVPAGKGRAAEGAVVSDDARLAQQFVEKWQPRVESMAHARHRKMLEVILGETVEQKRFFDEMLAGRDDVLGRRHANVGTGGGVLATRWME